MLFPSLPLLYRPGSDPTAEHLHFTWEHTITSRPDPDGPEYLATHGEYTQLYDVANHAIFPLALWSPAVMGSVQPVPIAEHPHAIVPLGRWSGITWLLWWHETINDPRLRNQLQYIGHIMVENEPTQDIMNEALEKSDITEGLQGAAYPGKTFNLHDNGDQFLALLGTPSGSGVAYLLAQHKAATELGWKSVETIQVFCMDCDAEEDDGKEIVMILKLADVSGPKGPE